MRTFEISNGFRIVKSGGILLDKNRSEAIVRGISELHSKGYDVCSLHEFKEPFPEWVQFQLTPEKFATERNPKPYASENVYIGICKDNNIIVIVGHRSEKNAPDLIRLAEEAKRLEEKEEKEK